jgi:ankyrin repeat protein
MDYCIANSHFALLNIAADEQITSTQGCIESLCAAARHGDFMFIRKLLHLGVDLNCTGLAGHSPLHHAISFGDVSTLDYLLDHHAQFSTNLESELTSGVATERLLRVMKNRLVERAADPKVWSSLLGSSMPPVCMAW